MNLFALSGLLTFVSALSLGIFSWIKGKKFLNKIWAIFNFAVAVWGLGAFKFSTTLNQNDVFFWLRFANIGVILIPVFFIHFVFEFLEIKKTRIIFATYFLGLMFFTLNITDWVGITKVFITNLRYVFNSFYVDSPPGPAYSLFVVFFFGTVIYAHFLAMKFLKACQGIKRMQIKYFLVASALGFSGGGTTFLMVFNIDVYPILHFTVPLYPMILTYAIFKYKLMDINIVFKRSLVYSILVASITLIYLIIVWSMERSFQTAIGYRSFPITILALLAIALLFQPLKNRIQRFVDLRFFKGTLESLAEEKEKLQEEVRRTDQLRVAATLASGIAHEIKNPVTSIKTFTNFLAERHQDKTFVEKFRTVVGEELNRIEGLTKDLLDFAKPHPPKFERIDIHVVLRRVIGLVDHGFQAEKIRLITSFTDAR